MKAWFPPHLVYKEWRQQRIWFVLAGLVLLLGPGFEVMKMLSQLYPDSPRYIPMAAINNASEIRDNFNVSSILPMFLLVAIGLGVQALCIDRSQGGLTYTLSGPVSRLDLLKAKWFVAWSGLMVLMTGYAAVTCIEAAIFRLGTPSASAVIGFITLAILLTVILTVAFTVSVVVGNIIAAGVATGIVLMSPAVLYVFLEVLTDGHLSGGMSIMMVSPIVYVFHPNSIPVAGLGWSIVVGILSYIAARKLFQVWAPEHAGNFYQFPVMWKYTVAFICAGIGMAAGGILQQRHPGSFLVGFIIVTGGCWWIAKKAFQAYGKRMTT